MKKNIQALLIATTFQVAVIFASSSPIAKGAEEDYSKPEHVIGYAGLNLDGESFFNDAEILLYSMTDIPMPSEPLNKIDENRGGAEGATDRKKRKTDNFKVPGLPVRKQSQRIQQLRADQKENQGESVSPRKEDRVSSSVVCETPKTQVADTVVLPSPSVFGFTSLWDEMAQDQESILSTPPFGGLSDEDLLEALSTPYNPYLVVNFPEDLE